MSQAMGKSGEKPGEKPGEKSGRWTDAEKLALLTSILAAAGPFKWENVRLPAGRTRKACLHVYTSAVQQAKEVPMGDNQNAEFVGPPRTKKSPAGKATGTTKGKRGRSKTVLEEHVKSDHSEDEPQKKKIKKEELGSDEQRVEEPVSHEI
ncbi:MAG: hypothetical protein Q9174_004950 [Haloplaca sp. 1 TL-2023]